MTKLVVPLKTLSFGAVIAYMVITFFFVWKVVGIPERERKNS